MWRKRRGWKSRSRLVNWRIRTEYCGDHFDCSRRGKGVSSGQQYWRGEYPDHPSEWNGGCPYRAESCFDRASQGCTRDDCCGYRADGRVWVNICNFHLARETKGGVAVMTIESDSHFVPELNEKINRLENIYSSTMLERV